MIKFVVSVLVSSFSLMFLHTTFKYDIDALCVGYITGYFLCTARGLFDD